MFLLLTGSRGTAYAKFVVLIVSVVGAEIELDLGPISYTRQRISQERCRKCPLWVKSRRGHVRFTTESGHRTLSWKRFSVQAELTTGRSPILHRSSSTRLVAATPSRRSCSAFVNFWCILRFFGILISQPVQQIDILGHSFFRDLERREARQLGHRLIAKLSPAAGDAARRKFAALLRLNTRDV
jgi:hypothetical protein